MREWMAVRKWTVVLAAVSLMALGCSSDDDDQQVPDSADDVQGDGLQGQGLQDQDLDPDPDPDGDDPDPDGDDSEDPDSDPDGDDSGDGGASDSDVPASAMHSLIVSDCGGDGSSAVQAVQRDGGDSLDDGMDGLGGADESEAMALLAESAAASTGLSVRGVAVSVSSLGGGPDQYLASQFEFGAGGALTMTAPESMEAGADSPSSVIGCELRYADGGVYVRVQETQAAGLGFDTEGADGEWVWLTVPADLLADVEQGYPLGLMCRVSGPDEADDLICDPMGTAAVFAEAATDAAIIGGEEIGGVSTTKVGFTVSLLDAIGDSLSIEGLEGMADLGFLDGADLDGLGGLGGSGLSAQQTPDEDDSGMDDAHAGFLLLMLRQMLEAGLEAEIWIDENKLIRRFSLDFALMFNAFAGFAEMTDSEYTTVPGELFGAVVIVDFQDFDTGITVDAPPSESVVGELRASDLGLGLGADAL